MSKLVTALVNDADTVDVYIELRNCRSWTFWSKCHKAYQQEALVMALTVAGATNARIGLDGT